jgi:hypothetical protein
MKMLRQPACSIRRPPSVGPITNERPLHADQMPSALRRFAGSGQTTAIKASDDGNSNAAPIPAMMRPPTRMATLGATAQTSEPATKTTAPAMKTSRRLYRSARSPPVNNSTA